MSQGLLFGENWLIFKNEEFGIICGIRFPELPFSCYPYSIFSGFIVTMALLASERMSLAHDWMSAAEMEFTRSS